MFIGLLCPQIYPSALFSHRDTSRLVYTNTLDELKEAIYVEVTQVEGAYTNFQERLQQCIVKNCHHVTVVISIF